MALLGQGAIAMWWDIAPEKRSEFEDWHAHEHFPERMAIPGFLRGSRWSAIDGGEGMFVMYELESYETLRSSAYLARLNAPTLWSTSMMPHHRNMVRSQCRVLESSGGGISRHALTVRLSPAAGAAQSLRNHLRALARELSAKPGTTAGHLLQNQSPNIEPTTEQKIRGGPDPSADWIFLVCGYDRAALERVALSDLSDEALGAAGSAASAVRGLYSLAHTNTNDDAGLS